MDPLSELLSLLKPRRTMSAGFDVGGEWSFHFDGHQAEIKCYIIEAGQCWLAVEGVDRVVSLDRGDCFVMPNGRPFRLASDLAMSAQPASTIFAEARNGETETINGGGSFSLVGSRFSVNPRHADLLRKLLPPVVHFRDGAEQTALRWAVDRMMQELRTERPGGHLIAQDLAHLWLVCAMRVQLADAFGQDSGWLFALADKQLGAAIAAIHANPARRWTLRELGEPAGMSRSVFALRFRTVVGETPMQYLARWRMLLACDRLENGNEPIALIADALGYESEGAFSTAFRRLIGQSPQQHRRGARDGSVANPRVRNRRASDGGWTNVPNLA